VVKPFFAGTVCALAAKPGLIPGRGLISEKNSEMVKQERWLWQTRRNAVGHGAVDQVHQKNRVMSLSFVPVPSLRQRCRQPELMDQPGLGLAVHARALEGLGRINALSRTAAVLWEPMVQIARSSRGEGRSIRVLDLATGGGTVAMSLAQRAAREELDVIVDGSDLNPQAIELAQRQTAMKGLQCRFFVLDALSQPLPQDYDILTCSLFLHHLDDADAIALLGRMGSAARRLVLVDDLVRSRSGYLLAVLACRLLSGSRIVHVDGPLSVAAAFTPGEALSLAARAGLLHAKLIRHWPQRFLMSWSAT
jgi:2-polyprenyl-3-methyl-5-hydroxy-6-metoxy-1,4-benzoquinol methylase